MYVSLLYETSLSVLRLHQYPYNDHLMSHDTYAAFLSTDSNLSLMVEYTYRIYRHCVSVRRSCRQWYSCSLDLSRTLSTSCGSIAYHVPRSYSTVPGKRYLHRQQGCYGAPRRRRTPNFEEDVLHRVEEIPSTSTRNIA